MNKFDTLVKSGKCTCITMGMEIPKDYPRPEEWVDAERLVVALLVDNNNHWIFNNYSIETQDAVSFLHYMSKNAYDSGFRHGLDFLKKVDERDLLDYAISPVSFVDAIERLTNKVNG